MTIIEERRALGRALISGDISALPDTWERAAHNDIARAMGVLNEYGRKVDLVTVHGMLKDLSGYSPAYLAGLPDDVEDVE